MATDLSGINVGQASKNAVYKTGADGKVSAYDRNGTLIASGFADEEGARAAIKQLERNYIAERDKRWDYLKAAVTSLKKSGAWKKMTPEERVAAKKTALKDVSLNYYDNLKDALRADGGTLSTYFDRYKVSAAATTTSAAATAPPAAGTSRTVAVQPNTLAGTSLPVKQAYSGSGNGYINDPARPAGGLAPNPPQTQPVNPVNPAYQRYDQDLKAPKPTTPTPSYPTAAQRVVAAKTQFQSAPSRVVNNAGSPATNKAVTTQAVSQRRTSSPVAGRYAALRK